jgi:hypothetical protein
MAIGELIEVTGIEHVIVGGEEALRLPFDWPGPNLGQEFAVRQSRDRDY